MKLLFSKDGLRRKIMSDPDDEPTAGNMPLDPVREALCNLMAAYERRVRSACNNAEELSKEPWRCAEYIEAERALVQQPRERKTEDS